MAEIWSEGLRIRPAEGEAVFLPFTQIAKVDSADFGIHVTYASGVVFLSSLGQGYNQFFQRLTDAWGDALAKALLMADDDAIFETRATYINVRRDGSQSFGPCRARVTHRGLVILPMDSPPVKLQFAKFVSAQAQNLRMNIETVDRGVVELLRIGASYQSFCEKLVIARRDFDGRFFEGLQDVGQGVGSDRLLELSRLMAEGRALSRMEVMKRAYDFWLALERLVKDSPLAPYYASVRQLSAEELNSIGRRMTSHGNLVWFMVAIPGSVEEGGNTVVADLASVTGHTTYLFRMLERAKFPTSSPKEMLAVAKSAMGEINEGLVSVGFREGPIFLDEATLKTPPFIKYVFASKNLPELRSLRDRFYGRIVGADASEWAADLKEALLFNVTSSDDSAKWVPSSGKTESPEMKPG